jgi:putative membrane protein
MVMHMGLMVVVGVFWLMALAGVALLVVWFMRTRPQSPTAAQVPMRETPLQILDRRFAAGEIDAEEYKRSRDLLGGSKT